MEVNSMEMMVDGVQLSPPRHPDYAVFTHHHHHHQQGLPTSPSRKRQTVNVGSGSIGKIVATSAIFSNLTQSVTISKDTLLSIQLNDCSLATLDVFSVCASLRELDVANNCIKYIPEFKDIKMLQFLNVSSNCIRQVQDFGFINTSSKSVATSLLSLNAKDNPVTQVSSYSKVLLTRLSKLLVLDENMIYTVERSGMSITSLRKADEPNYLFNQAGTDVITYFRWGSQSRALNPSIPNELLQNSRVSDIEAIKRNIDIRIKCLYHIYYTNDPIVKIQLLMKDIVNDKRISVLTKFVSKIQAIWRGKMYRLEVVKELNKTLAEHAERHKESKLAWHVEYDLKSIEQRFLIIIKTYIMTYLYRRRRKKMAMRIQRLMRMYLHKMHAFYEMISAHHFVNYGLVMGLTDLDELQETVDDLRAKYKIFHHVQVGLIKRTQNGLYVSNTIVDKRAQQVMLVDMSDTPCRRYIQTHRYHQHVIGPVHDNCRFDHNEGKTENEKLKEVRSFRTLCFQQATEDERHKLILLRRRLGMLSRRLRGAYVRHLEEKRSIFDSEYSHVLEVYVDNKYFLYHLVHMLKARKIPMDFLFIVQQHMNVSEIQRIFRGYITRKKVYKGIVYKILRRRAIICIQRFFRFSMTLGKRLSLLKMISDVVSSINDNSLYLDVIFYYILQKIPMYSKQSQFSRFFPEFCGVPCVDTLRNEFNSIVGYASRFSLCCQSGPSVMMTKLNSPDCQQSKSRGCRDKRTIVQQKRIGIPRWCSWHLPFSETSVDSRSRASDRFQTLLSTGCDTKIEKFTVEGGAEDDAQLGESERSIRLVKLEFQTVQEAKLRAAMIVLSTYDPRSRGAVVPLSFEAARHRVIRMSSFILNDLRGMNSADSQHVFPLETRVVLQKYPPRFYLLVECQRLLTTDRTRIRYFLESVQNTDNTSKIDKKLFEPPQRCNMIMHEDTVEKAYIARIENFQYHKTNEDILLQQKTKETLTKQHADQVTSQPQRKLTQFDGHLTYIPEGQDPVVYFNTTSAKERLERTRQKHAQDFRERNQRLVSNTNAKATTSKGVASRKADEKKRDSEKLMQSLDMKCKEDENLLFSNSYDKSDETFIPMPRMLSEAEEVVHDKSNRTKSKTTPPITDDNVPDKNDVHRRTDPLVEKATKRKEKDKRRQKRIKDARVFSMKKCKELTSFIKKEEKIGKRRADFLKFRQRVDQIRDNKQGSKAPISDEFISQERIRTADMEDCRQRLATFASLDRRMHQDFDYNPIPPECRKNYPSFSYISRSSQHRSPRPRSTSKTLQDDIDHHDMAFQIPITSEGVIHIPSRPNVSNLDGFVDQAEASLDTFSPQIGENPRYMISDVNENNTSCDIDQNKAPGINIDSDVNKFQERALTQDLELGSVNLGSCVEENSEDIMYSRRLRKSIDSSRDGINIDMRKLMNELDQFMCSGRPSSSSFLMRTDTHDR